MWRVMSQTPPSKPPPDPPARSYVGILSDTHNHESNTSLALAVFRDRGIDRLIHCGDVTGAAMLELFAGFEMWLVRGNNDRDALDFRSVARRMGGIHYMGGEALLKIDGHPVAVCHGDDGNLLDGLAYSRAFEWVFYGHSHEHSLVLEGATRLLNPGALGGRHLHSEPRSVAIVDLARGDAEFFTL